MFYFIFKGKTSSTHNMHEESKIQSPYNVISTTNINKIVISNLDFGVSSSDIEVCVQYCLEPKKSMVFY